MTSVDFQQRLRDLVNLSIRTYTGQAAGFEERDSLIAALTRSHATLLAERDAARAEVERLRKNVANVVLNFGDGDEQNLTADQLRFKLSVARSVLSRCVQ